MSKYFESNNGLMYDFHGNVVMATTINENGKELVFYTNEDNALDMFNIEQPYDLFEEFENSQLQFGLRVFKSESINEATQLKLPLNSEKDMSKLNYYECLDKINKVPHINLWITPQQDRKDKYSSCWIWVELPKEIEEAKYVPIIHHRSGGVSVHPYFHKYFLRSFDKRTRHLILGFCYIYGPIIERKCTWAAEENKDIDDYSLMSLQHSAFKYKDSDAPKRINMGPKSDNGYFKLTIDDYERWVKSLK